jgi:hypothetical protein
VKNLHRSSIIHMDPSLVSLDLSMRSKNGGHAKGVCCPFETPASEENPALFEIPVLNQP